MNRVQEGRVSALKTIATRWMEDVWQRGDLDAVDELHAPDFVDRSPAGRGSDLASYRKGIAELYAAFPNFRAIIEDLIVESRTGKVVIRWRATGTHRGSFLGVEATGRVIRFRGIEILQIEAGKIVERWGEWDGLNLVDQLRGDQENVARG